MAGTRLIVGLGNPGPEYSGTRHNVGFETIGRVATKTGLSPDGETMLQRAVHVVRGSGLYEAASGKYRGRSLVLAKPTTFMNRSGLAISKLKGRFTLDNQDILIIVDDIHLDLGSIRIRPSGGSGGHNGLQDIIERLDSDNFPRIRIGVGSSFRRGRQADYVLESFSDDERLVVNSVVDHAADAALAFVTDGVNAAMNLFNKQKGGFS